MTKEERIIELRSGKMELNFGRWTKEDRKHLAEMYAQGVDMTDIALILRRSERAITTQIDKKWGCASALALHRVKRMDAYVFSVFYAKPARKGLNAINER